jgi:superfamily II DNA or RNA helicase
MHLMAKVSYDRARIEKWLGSHTLAKGQGYIDAVSDLQWAGDSLTARVKGTQRTPYSVEIYFDGRFQGYCSCPVGVNCKHVAATLLANLGDSLEPKPRNPVRPEISVWLAEFRARLADRKAKAQRRSSAAPTSHTLAYVFTPSPFWPGGSIVTFKVRLGVDGAMRAAERWNGAGNAVINPPKFVPDDDLPILRQMLLRRTSFDHSHFALTDVRGAGCWEQLLATQRLFYASNDDIDEMRRWQPLRRGTPRDGAITWHVEPNDLLRPALRMSPPATAMLATDPPWYIDAQSNETGPVQPPLPATQLNDFLSMPALSLTEAEHIRTALQESAPEFPLPSTKTMENARVVDAEPVPVLSFDTLPYFALRFGKYGHQAGELDFATVSFEYAGFSVQAATRTSLIQGKDGALVQIKRDEAREQAWLAELADAGMQQVSSSKVVGPRTFPRTLFALASPKGWPAFMGEALPRLREAGWRVNMAGEFRHNVVEVDTIEGAAISTGDGWFDLDMGITVGERTLRLDPLLADLFRRDRRWLGGLIDSIPDGEDIELRTLTGERLKLTADRLKPLVRVLIDLFERLPYASSASDSSEPLRLPLLDAGRLAALNDTLRWEFHGDASVCDLARRLKEGARPSEVAVPRGLRAGLRDYQREGLNWMQFLRAQGLAGVLADDMGLGKTVQTLAHIVAEKEAGRLDRPALIVVPTTLVSNWREEAARFAPELKVLDLHGPDRHARFDAIGEHEMIVTTYALLWRDHDALARHDYHLLILDEAQYVKNAATKAAASIRSLRARHRLCLTGTPLENHLGELWAQFDFLLPGFLGNQKDFTRLWRNPIEKNGDTVRRDLLARRVRPFMLRRRKDEVARELPPKTTIVRVVDLEGAQRDLYETMRASMHEKVRAAVSAQGFARSHIIVLDALLKLRQVCCDPSLVKLKEARAVKESAKLGLLLEMLPELIDEGRRVLVFSQFAGMLAIIAAALDRAEIGYELLTGDTEDRRTPVRRFQNGEVPVFLISLKAGGVGLNLTAADTVIHYDPWWNPAAENQATDRAHRIGQDKPVFVYKLVAAGSIEEKILSMQEKKAALAASILSEDAAGAVKFSDADIEALFAPITGG